ncbi:MAG: hypothetical protein ACLUIW_11200 [Dysosmobacter welbionis]
MRRPSPVPAGRFFSRLGPAAADSAAIRRRSSLRPGRWAGSAAAPAVPALIQELGGARDSNARQLLYALRPYLKPERQEKVERALQLARLFHLGRKFLAGWEG